MYVRETKRDRTHIAVKAAKVNETGAWKLSWLLMINTEEEIQGEAGDHRSKKLYKDKTR